MPGKVEQDLRTPVPSPPRPPLHAPISMSPGPKAPRPPIGIDGLYLGGAGCHGGPGITFIPGYNAGYQVLDDLG